MRSSQEHQAELLHEAVWNGLTEDPTTNLETLVREYRSQIVQGDFDTEVILVRVKSRYR